ncbi:MAG: hypothetical protein RBS80_25365 [Thermoguttaceae bacterium]|nr:hypothetical protein [Thermoguttaceae bacterium]
MIASPNKTSSQEGPPRRRLPWPIRFLASLQLAVVLIAIYAMALVWATTIIERNYGYESRAVFFGVYEAWWFAVLNVLLAVNVLMSALVRLPWKRRHLGFLLTHAGILVLMAGFVVGHFWGIESRLHLYEGNAEHRALNDNLYLKLTVLPGESAPHGGVAESEPRSVVEIPFRGGPFNWEDYDQLPYLPWHLARRDRGTIYHHDGIHLEVLDYYAHSHEIEVPRVRVAAIPGTRTGRSLGDDAAGETVELVVRPTRDPHGPGRRELAGGQRMVFWMAASREETDAMLDSKPEGDLGPSGQLVLHAAGRKFCLPVHELQEQRRQPLGDTGLEVELVQFIPQLLAVQLEIHHAGESPQRLLLLADFPELSRHDAHHRVYGAFYFDPDAGRPEGDQARLDPRVLDNARRGRIDLVQGADRKLYYRAWRPPDAFAAGALPSGGEPTVLLGPTPEALTIRVLDFEPAERPGTKLVPQPFNRKLSPGRRQPQAFVRLTVDGQSDEFWLAGLPYGMPDTDEDGRPAPLPREFRGQVAGEGRRVAVTMPRGDVPLGFSVFLHRFDRKLDPGADTVSHYASLVDFLDRGSPPEPLLKDVLVTLNAPVDFTDPATGRSYRFYQSSFDGPFRPGDPQYERSVADREQYGQVFLSVLSVNYDPGRGLKYFGSVLISIGFVLIFYMRKTARRSGG